MKINADNEQSVTPQEFNLRALVRETLDASTLTDPGQIAAEVDRRIPASLAREALRQALRHYVRQVVSEQRAQTRIGEPRPGKSAKVTRIREHWQRSLRDRVHIGQAKWKFLGDCTYDDLVYAAAERREQAERNAAKARQYESLARLLTEHDVETVRALPADTLMRALGAAA